MEISEVRSERSSRGDLNEVSSWSDGMSLVAPRESPIWGFPEYDEPPHSDCDSLVSFAESLVHTTASGCCRESMQTLKSFDAPREEEPEGGEAGDRVSTVAGSAANSELHSGVHVCNGEPAKSSKSAMDSVIVGTSLIISSLSVERFVILPWWYRALECMLGTLVMQEWTEGVVREKEPRLVSLLIDRIDPSVSQDSPMVSQLVPGPASTAPMRFPERERSPAPQPIPPPREWGGLSAAAARCPERPPATSRAWARGRADGRAAITAAVP